MGCEVQAGVSVLPSAASRGHRLQGPGSAPIDSAAAAENSGRASPVGRSPVSQHPYWSPTEGNQPHHGAQPLNQTLAVDQVQSDGAAAGRWDG